MQPLEYLFTPGGAHKANRLIAEGLAARGHQCHVISGGPLPGSEGLARIAADLEEQALSYRQEIDHVLSFDLNQVRVDVATDSMHMFALIRTRIETVKPDVVLVSEDPSMLMLRIAIDAGAPRTVYLSHSQATLPFGPAAFERQAQRTKILQQATGIIAVSHFVADYIQTHGAMTAEVIYSPVYGSPTWPQLGRPDHGAIAMINPSRIKGLDIFLALARQNPHLPFMAVPTWATTAEDLADLKAAKVEIVPPSNQIDDILASVRVLLVPSLWGEAFGQIVVETMLRGIPVMASNLGGLPEAKLGVDYLLPVREIEAYGTTYNERNLLTPIVPPQDIAPWQTALDALMNDAEHYQSIASQSRDAARAFVARGTMDAYVSFLQRSSKQSTTESAQAKRLKRMQQLTPQQRALLARRLQNKTLETMGSAKP